MQVLQVDVEAVRQALGEESTLFGDSRQHALWRDSIDQGFEAALYCGQTIELKFYDADSKEWIEVDFLTEAETGHHIYSEGRCGGYLYVEEISDVLDPDEMLETQDDEEEPPQVSEWARETLKILLKFKNEWERLLKDIKAWLNSRPLPQDV